MLYWTEKCRYLGEKDSFIRSTVAKVDIPNSALTATFLRCVLLGWSGFFFVLLAIAAYITAIVQLRVLSVVSRLVRQEDHEALRETRYQIDAQQM